MMDTSDGSRVSPQRDPNQFLTDYARGVELAIQKMQNYRLPPLGATAMSGATSMAAQI